MAFISSSEKGHGCVHRLTNSDMARSTEPAIFELYLGHHSSRSTFSICEVCIPCVDLGRCRCSPSLAQRFSAFCAVEQSRPNPGQSTTHPVESAANDAFNCSVKVSVRCSSSAIVCGGCAQVDGPVSGAKMTKPPCTCCFKPRVEWFHDRRNITASREE